MENTMASFDAAFDSGLRYLELDVAISKDGVVFVGHCHERLHEDCKHTPTQPLIRDHTFDELQLASPTVVSTLEKVLRKFKHRMAFQIELKHETDYRLGRLCNMALSDARCWQRALQPGRLVEGVLAVVERVGPPSANLTISSFEGPRPRNWLQVDLSRGVRPALKLVGG